MNYFSRFAYLLSNDSMSLMHTADTWILILQFTTENRGETSPGVMTLMKSKNIKKKNLKIHPQHNAYVASCEVYKTSSYIIFIHSLPRKNDHWVS